MHIVVIFLLLSKICGIFSDNANSTTVEDHPAWKYIEDPNESCGQSDADRIVGGKVAALGQYPWLAQLGYRSRGKIVFQCGGALISSLYVVTAGHCASGLKLVRLGEYDTTTSIDCFGDVCADPVQDINVSKTIVHELYEKPAYTHDIALIRLEKPAVFNGWVSPICLPRYITKVSDSGTVEVAGWGFVDLKTMNTATVLQTIKLPIIPLAKCKIQLERFPITEENLCAGGVLGEDSCSGDSGGPMMMVDASTGSPQYVMVGVVSYGTTTCGIQLPGVFANVRYYLQWILDRIEP